MATESPLMDIIRETHAKRDLDVITGPTDPESPFGGRMVTVQRTSFGEAKPGMVLACFIWPPFTWPVPRTENLLSLFEVTSVLWEPVWGRGVYGLPVYQGQEVTLYAAGRWPSTRPPEHIAWKVTELEPEGVTGS